MSYEHAMIVMMQVGVEATALLSALHHAVFAEHEPWSQAAFEQIFTMPGAEVWLACKVASQSVNNEPKEALPIGFIVSRSVLDEGEILSLGVHPAWRRRGIGRYMLRHLLHKARQEGMTLFLEVRLSNKHAAALYEQEGFQQIAVRPHYYQDGEDARIFRYLTDSV
ncbi:ribosomal protein S18-alanine N-acetyltransferase [Bombella pollinis]|uniref:Ribosomal protein S18-alanine N-acetyltransferase n=1 Tax=Bombella pollinis TaxID=2967337 RepID=A0ABT3WTZ6_9PROT|nr:ribosomal protein S18-alanine N-acetyltransferase [Bombella pollinis]MCX5620351.1 ribosomal protein S18-alanine N-acetyltransferase [Bombella pollinis]